MNAMLREQLEQASVANEALSQDIRRLTADWTKAREELEQKELDWRREEEVEPTQYMKYKRNVKVSDFVFLCVPSVLPQLFQQRTQSAADALATNCWVSEKCL